MRRRRERPPPPLPKAPTTRRADPKGSAASSPPGCSSLTFPGFGWVEARVALSGFRGNGNRRSYLNLDVQSNEWEETIARVRKWETTPAASRLLQCPPRPLQ